MASVAPRTGTNDINSSEIDFSSHEEKEGLIKLAHTAIESVDSHARSNASRVFFALTGRKPEESDYKN